MTLLELEVQDDSVGERNRLFWNKDRLARNIPSPRTGVDAPSCIGFAVDGELNRAVGPFVASVALPASNGIGGRAARPSRSVRFRRRGRYQQYQASDDAAVAIADPMSLSTTSCV